MLGRQITSASRNTRYLHSIINDCCKQVTAPIYNKNKHSHRFSTEANTSESQNSTDKECENKLGQEIEELKKEVEGYKDKYQRSLAEAENIRMRLRKEVDDAKLFGIQSFCKDLLNVADIMNFAVKSVSEEKVLSEEDQIWKSFHEGVCMTEKELHKVFEHHGLAMLSPDKGDKFNPYDHEALFEVPTPDMEPGLIAHVERLGYQLKGRTLRPARVGVSRKL